MIDPQMMGGAPQPMQQGGVAMQPPPMPEQQGGGIESPNPQFVSIILQRLNALGPQVIQQFEQALMQIQDQPIIEILANIVPELGPAFMTLAQQGGGLSGAGGTPPAEAGTPSAGMAGMEGAPSAGVDAMPQQDGAANPLVSQINGDDEEEEQPRQGRMSGMYPV